MVNRPVKQPKLSDIILVQLEEMIVAGSLLPGRTITRTRIS